MKPQAIRKCGAVSSAIIRVVVIYSWAVFSILTSRFITGKGAVMPRKTRMYLPGIPAHVA
jgi:hypothetical protein